MPKATHGAGWKIQSRKASQYKNHIKYMERRLNPAIMLVYLHLLTKLWEK
jgi:hypothetical protein